MSSISLLVITALVLAPDINSSSTALSWPHGTEFANSFLNFTTFSNLSYYLSGDDQGFFCFSKDVPPAILQWLADVDYRKSLIAGQMSLELRDSSNAFFFCIWTMSAQTLSHTVFEHTHTDLLEEWFLAAFLLVCFKYGYPQWIYPHNARLLINWRKQRSSDYTLLFLAWVVPQCFFTLSPTRIQWGGTVDFINLDIEKSRLYGIGSITNGHLLDLWWIEIWIQKCLGAELDKWQKMLLSLRSNPQTMSPYIQNCDGLCTRIDHHMLLPIVLHMVPLCYE